MPDTTLFLGGSTAIRFALPLAAVGGIVGAADLPARRREVNLPGLFDQATAEAEDDRYARVQGLDEPAFLRLGKDVKTVEIDEARVEPIPRMLRTTAARWGWAGLIAEDGRATIVVDALALARIGAERSAAPRGDRA